MIEFLLSIILIALGLFIVSPIVLGIIFMVETIADIFRK